MRSRCFVSIPSVSGFVIVNSFSPFGKCLERIYKYIYIYYQFIVQYDLKEVSCLCLRGEHMKLE